MENKDYSDGFVAGEYNGTMLVARAVMEIVNDASLDKSRKLKKIRDICETEIEEYEEYKAERGTAEPFN